MYQVTSTPSRPKQGQFYRHLFFLQFILLGLYIENSNEFYSSSACTTDTLRTVLRIVMPFLADVWDPAAGRSINHEVFWRTGGGGCIEPTLL